LSVAKERRLWKDMTVTFFGKTGLHP
jgi:hypothetical protein